MRFARSSRHCRTFGGDCCIVENWDSGWLWVVDPIDGTSNFSRGIPTFAVNIALCQDGEPVLGLTHQPVTGAEFFATKGEGLFVDGERASVSPARELSECLMGIGLGYDYERSKMLLDLLSDLWPGVVRSRTSGRRRSVSPTHPAAASIIYVQPPLPVGHGCRIVQVREAAASSSTVRRPVTIYSEGYSPARQTSAGVRGETRERRWR